VIYSEGAFDNHVIAHESGLARRLIPRMKVLPTSPMAMAESRHPITDIGLFHLVDKLLRFREIELADPEARTVLDWYTDEQGRRWARSIHERDGRDSGYPFPRAEVLYDPVTFIPHAFTGYDWPDSDAGPDSPLGEQYIYEDVVLNAPLDADDFDPSNPEYAFSRF
jgi:hypothetical protein